MGTPAAASTARWVSAVRPWTPTSSMAASSSSSRRRGRDAMPGIYYGGSGSTLLVSCPKGHRRGRLAAVVPAASSPPSADAVREASPAFAQAGRRRRVSPGGHPGRHGRRAGGDVVRASRSSREADRSDGGGVGGTSVVQPGRDPGAALHPSARAAGECCPAHQRHGVGTALMHGVLAAADPRSERPEVGCCSAAPARTTPFGSVLAAPLGLPRPSRRGRRTSRVRPAPRPGTGRAVRSGTRQRSTASEPPACSTPRVPLRRRSTVERTTACPSGQGVQGG